MSEQTVVVTSDLKYITKSLSKVAVQELFWYWGNKFRMIGKEPDTLKFKVYNLNTSKVELLFGHFQVNTSLDIGNEGLVTNNLSEPVFVPKEPTTVVTIKIDETNMRVVRI